MADAEKIVHDAIGDPGQFRDLLFKTWPYQKVASYEFQHENIVECQVCRCLVVNRGEHTRSCFSSLSEEILTDMGKELGRLIKERNA